VKVDPAKFLDFTGRTVLVVGASLGGIGAAIAAAFKAAGAEVTITGVEAQPVEADRDRYPYVRLDVRDEGEIAALAAANPELDVLVNCAGYSDRDRAFDLAAFREVVDVNLFGTMRTCCAFHPHLAKGRGSIINIASVYSTLGSAKVPG
jgi:NAD(P)-dependent dehydrogenase (short-subunit alcohol dehydrogenase family)